MTNWSARFGCRSILRGPVKPPFLSTTSVIPTLIESIRLVNGDLPLLDYHQQRVDRSRRAHYGKAPAFRLQEVINGLPLPETGTHKLRLTYGVDLESYEVTPYLVKPVTSLRVVQGDHLVYSRKYADRSGIRDLYGQRGDCDDILITQRQHITDTSYANVALHDGSHWYTPAWPLLRGTRRAYLLEAGLLRSSLIRQRDLHNFERIRLINAMLPWEEGPTLSSAAVVE